MLDQNQGQPWFRSQFIDQKYNKKKREYIVIGIGKYRMEDLAANGILKYMKSLILSQNQVNQRPIINLKKFSKKKLVEP